MGGRGAATTNGWDPAQHSIAQDMFESKVDDVYRYFVEPPKSLSFGDRRERRKILKIVYPLDTRREGGGHLDLDSIEAEALDMLEKNPAEAARFSATSSSRARAMPSTPRAGAPSSRPRGPTRCPRRRWSSWASTDPAGETTPP
jgi:hypothetical protein